MGSLLGYFKPRADPKVGRGFAQSPFHVPPIFDGSRFLVFALINAGCTAPTSVTIKAQTPDGPLAVRLDVGAKDRIEGRVIQSMAARALIRDLDDGVSWLHDAAAMGGRATDEEVRAETVRLGIAHGLASKHTSYVAVEQRAEGTHRVPVYLGPSSGAHAAPGYARKSRKCQQSHQGIQFIAPDMLVSCSSDSTADLSRFDADVLAFMTGGLSTKEICERRLRKVANIVNVRAMPSIDDVPLLPPPVTGPLQSCPPPPLSPSLLALHCTTNLTGSANKLSDIPSASLTPTPIGERVALLESTASSASSATPQPSHSETLATVVQLQAFDGSFELTLVLTTTMGLALDIAVAGVPHVLMRAAGLSEAERLTAWATALAVAFMRLRLADLEADGVLVAGKAAKWLQARLPGLELIAIAETLLLSK